MTYVHEPLEMPIRGQNRVERISGRPDPQEHGRTIIPALLRDAIDVTRYGVGKMHPNALSMVEVGSWAGSCALEMIESVEHGTLYCVDTWEGSPNDVTGIIASELGPRVVFQTFCRNMGEHLMRRVVPCVGRSKTWASIWPFQVAAIYIDAGHEYPEVKADLEAWWPHVLPGGLFFGHDFNSFPGVKKAVEEFWRNNVPGDGNPLCVDEEVWWIWKPFAEEPPRGQEQGTDVAGSGSV
ncbi:MAG: class I SAM-dependent methyltransferase [Gemmataceae bacterium]|nr:class I SAM-dependent methyltransferase [Gemmataceae bacterium]